jgi:hypothetical protein
MLLHLLRALLEHSAKDKFSFEFLFNPNTFLEATQGFHSDLAIEVPLNPTNGKLRLHTLGGRQVIFTKTRRTYTTVEHRVVELFKTLEKLIDNEAEVKTSAKAFSVRV